MKNKSPVIELAASDSRIRVMTVRDILKLIFLSGGVKRSESRAIATYKQKLFQALESEIGGAGIPPQSADKTANQLIIRLKQRLYSLFASERTTERDGTNSSQVRKRLRVVKNRLRFQLVAMACKFRYISMARKKRLVRVPLELCTNQYGFSYNNSGWHYWKDMVLAAAEGEPLIENQRWYRFVKQISQSSYTRLMTFHDPKLHKKVRHIPYGSFPWGPWLEGVTTDPEHFLDETFRRDMQNFMWYEKGKSTDEVCVKEYKHTMSVLYSILKNGYKFLDYDELPLLKVMQKENGELRFVSHDGAHRLAILAALGFDSIVVEVDLERFPAIREADVENWEYVDSGLLSKAEALELFNLYFKSDGTERLRAVNGVPSLQKTAAGGMG